MKKYVVLALPVVVTVLAAAVAFSQGDAKSSLSAAPPSEAEAQLDARVGALEVQVKALAARVDSLERLREEQRRTTEEDAKRVEETRVLVVPLGGLYHREGCRYIGAERSEISLKDAKARGYRPCRTCRPPE